MKHIVLSLLMVWMTPISWGAEFARGMVAVQNGDFATALREWTPLAEQGDDFAQYQVGRILSVGMPNNMLPDCEKAVIYLRKSAEQGNPEAKEFLSKINDVDNPSRGMRCEFKKSGLNKFIDDFSIWIKSKFSASPSGVSQISENDLLNMALVEGDTDMQFELARRYALGEHVIQDFVKAHYLYNLAASKGHDQAGKDRDILAQRMTSADISKAQQLARECVAKNYKGC